MRTLVSHRIPKVQVVIYTEVLQKDDIIHCGIFIDVVLLCKPKIEICLSDRESTIETLK